MVLVPPHLLSRLSDIILKQAGLYFPPERWNELERGIFTLAETLQMDRLKCAEWDLSAPMKKNRIVRIAVRADQNFPTELSVQSVKSGVSESS